MERRFASNAWAILVAFPPASHDCSRLSQDVLKTVLDPFVALYL